MPQTLPAVWVKPAVFIQKEGLTPRPLGRFLLGGGGDVFPAYAKISRRNLQYLAPLAAAFIFYYLKQKSGPQSPLFCF
jgi:hypothetical protein